LRFCEAAHTSPGLADKGIVQPAKAARWLAVLSLGLAASAAEIPLAERFWISGQINSITQFHPAFRSPYAGENSLRGSPERATSRVMTLFTGIRVTKSTELLLDIESAGGTGIGNGVGLAGYTNLDVMRNPALGSKPYAARYMVRQIVPLSREIKEGTAGPLGLAPTLPVRRLELRFGKLSTPDFFDVNSVASDSHLQFMNWTVDNYGAYDYAANQGYTFGALAEYYARNWVVRFMEATMPTVANGLELDLDLGEARAENLEWELNRGLLPERDGAIRVLMFANHARMGTYRQAIDNFLSGRTPDRPDIAATRQETRVKYGFGFNLEQQLTAHCRLFGRAGWNEGRYESFAYTEVNQTAAAGAQWSGAAWKRRGDKIGIAAVWNAISGDHRRYLELGGSGLLLGDGTLNYGREQIVEAYYNWSLGRGMSLGFDLQRIVNPGYNRDRGPILVPSLRAHIDIERSTFARRAQ
jgi:high affinity Mn2+ porin